MDIGLMLSGAAPVGEALEQVGQLGASMPALLTATLAVTAFVALLLRRRALARTSRPAQAPVAGKGDRLTVLSRILATEVARRRRSEVQLIDAHARLDQVQSQMIQRLRTASAMRDNETACHTNRVGQMARHLALLAGTDQDFADQLALAAPLHDVGKIGIPDAILLKPGPLDAQEWDVMRTHTTIGAGILMGSGLPLLDLAAEVALSHHERWDGEGYPRALKGNSIPVSGRIVCLVDVFDALMSVRPYKEAWPLVRVLDHLNDGAGRQFDPALVRLFLANLQDFVAIRDRNLTQVEEEDEGAEMAMEWESPARRPGFRVVS
ncbi:MAG: HD domain-containing protein [Azospirillaceae bacterium]|nr:HD domain-containing protein [Azospirillaceae bacterium]